MSKNKWKPALYDEKLSLITDYGKGVLDLLHAQKGERILDIGCGTGHLTDEIYQLGAIVTGIDYSTDMIAEAKQAYPQIPFYVKDAARFRTEAKFDAIFSNAALHWMRDAEKVVEAMGLALRPGGRIVVEFGGEDNIGQLLEAMTEVFSTEYGISFSDRNPWYFPSIGEYSSLLEAYGFRVSFAHNFVRPTILPDADQGLDHWMDNFADDFFFDFIDSEKQGAIEKVKEKIRDVLYIDNAWTLDYKRLRMLAVKR